jgi:hypothetical protein
MARTLEQERAAIEADAQRLEERRRRLDEKERDQAIQAVDKAGLLKLDSERLGRLLGRMKSLGIEEVEKRLIA